MTAELVKVVPAVIVTRAAKDPDRKTIRFMYSSMCVSIGEVDLEAIKVAYKHMFVHGRKAEDLRPLDSRCLRYDRRVYVDINDAWDPGDSFKCFFIGRRQTTKRAPFYTIHSHENTHTHIPVSVLPEDTEEAAIAKFLEIASPQGVKRLCALETSGALKIVNKVQLKGYIYE